MKRVQFHDRNRWHYLGRATLEEEDMKNKSLTQILKFARLTMYVARKNGTQEKTLNNLRYSSPTPNINGQNTS